MDKLFFKIPEACEMLSIGRSKFYELRDAGEVEVVKVGAAALVPAEALHALASRLRSEAMGSGARRLLELLDEEGRLDLGSLPAGVTIADLAEAKRAWAERGTAPDAAA